MACTTPPALTDEQINDVIDGLADLQTITHLDECEDCRLRFDFAKSLDQRLRAVLYRQDCPTSQILGEYELNLLDAENEAVIQAHVQTCPRCQEELNLLRDFLTAEPLEPSIKAAPRHERDRREHRPTPPNPRLLVAEPLQAVAAYASRGGAVSGAVQPRSPQRGIDLGMQPLQEVKGITIFMEVQENDGVLTLVGQLILEDFAAWVDALVQIRQGGSVLSVCAVDTTAGFRCRLTNRDPFDVTITSRKGVVLLLKDVQPGRSGQ
jgi:hypothetical protein